jgi:hypothetical protein
MKFVIVVSLLFCGSGGFAKLPDINMVRALYQQAPADEKACRELIEILKPYNETNNPLLCGYKASATMIMAKHVFNPFSKLSYFNQGKNMMEKAIATSPQNVELRFLRFAAQTKIPSFLGYKEKIKNDKKFLLTSLTRVHDIDLKKVIATFLKESDYVTEKEKNNIK